MCGIPFPLVKTQFLESDARFSPDGKWIAYTSNETGPWEIYIIPFNPPSEDPSAATEPTRGGKWQVSTQRGWKAKWRGDGKELFFMSGESKVTAVEIALTANGVEIGKASPLFPVDQPAGIDPFDVSPDGEWFVENAGTAQRSSPINLITNWDAELTQP